MNAKSTNAAIVAASGTKSAEQHARILDVYLSRLSLRGLKKIFESKLDCWHAQAKYGTNGQLETQACSTATVKEVVGRMLRGDLDNIERIVDESRGERRFVLAPSNRRCWRARNGDKRRCQVVVAA